MNDTITAAIEIKDVAPVFTAYQKFTGNSQATYDDLFNFLTTPTSEREEFLVKHCSCNYSSNGNIVSTKYKAL